MTNEERIRLACSELTNLTSALLKQSMESMMEIIMKPQKDDCNPNDCDSDNEDSYNYDDNFVVEEEFYGDYGDDDFYIDFDDESPFSSEAPTTQNTNLETNNTGVAADNTGKNAYNGGSSQGSLPSATMINYETPLDELELSVRAYNCLKRHGINSIGQLFDMSYDELCKVRTLGQKSLNEITQKLKEIREAYAVNRSGSQTDFKPQAGKSQPDPTSQVLSSIYMEKLNELIGLDEVKEQVKKIAAFVRMKQEMPKGSSVPMVLNMEFVGNPGTAKTTVARIMAGLLYEAGLLASSDIVEVGRSGLVAKYTGQTAVLVKSVFDRAEGKLLFIDEAYALADNDDGGFGDEAITTIVQEMENRRDSTIVVFAGYPDEMDEFFDKNPGLRSRVPFKIAFKDYTPDELYKISEIEAKRRGFTISPEATEKVTNIYMETAEDPRMGNGRYCRNIVESAILNYAYRNYGQGAENILVDSHDGSKPDFILRSDDFQPIHNMDQAKISAPIGFRG